MQESKAEDEKKKESLGISVTDGSFASITQTVYDQFLVPFAVLLSASAGHMGLLRALPQLGSAIIQLFAAEIAAFFKDKKKVIVVSAAIQALMWLPLLVAALFIHDIYLLLIAATLISVFGGLTSPLWSSWMGDLTFEKTRGEYFSHRNKINGLVSFIAILAFGLVLNFFSGIQMVFTGFALLFAIALVSRLVSVYMLTQMYQPQSVIMAEDSLTFGRFIRELSSTNVGKFVIFMTAMQFAINIGAPFFAVYVLDELHYNYIQYTVFTLVSTFAAFAFASYWGRHADRRGNKIIFAVTASVMPFLPLLWLITKNFYLITLFQAVGNFLFVGFSLSSTNFVYDAIRPQDRIRFLAYFNTLIGMAIFVGAVAGGALLTLFPAPPFRLGSDYHFLFLFTSLVRVAVVLAFIHQIQEVRSIEGPEKPDSEHFVELIFTDPMRSVANGVTTYAVPQVVNARNLGLHVISTIPQPGQLLASTVKPAAGALEKQIRFVKSPKELTEDFMSKIKKKKD